MPQPTYDYIIAGSGASGLSLAYHLNQAGLTDKRILLIERAPKTHNDRTWCFWEIGDNPFEPIIYRRWKKLAFYGEGFERALDIAPYQYKLLRGIDFYQFMEEWLAQQPNIERIYADVTATATQGEGIDGCAAISTLQQTYRASWAFSSIPQDDAGNRSATHGPRHTLLQHFKGWVIETEQPAFDLATATLMDFRVPQPLPGDMRFVYVMPFDAHKALVEYTVFSPSLLPDDDYRAGLRGYLRDVLKLDEYAIHEEESGVIPMTDAPFASRSSPRVLNIGTAGGRTKPSTGYTFLRIQEHSRQIAQALKATGQPHVAAPLAQQRFGFYDSVLLDVLEQSRRTGKTVFTELYRRNPVQRIFRFLDEKSTFTEEVQLMLSTHLPSFTAAAWRARPRI